MEKLNKEVQRLKQAGVTLPRHPVRASQDARELLDMSRAARTASQRLSSESPNEGTLKQIDENNKLISKMGRQRRLSNFGGGDVWAAIPRFYDPMEYWDLSGLPWNMADEGHRHKLHKWLRLYYATHYLVPILIDIFSRFPLVGLHLKSDDDELTDFYEDLFLDKLNYPEFMVSVGREYFLCGEAFPLGSFDEDLGIWEREELLNPEDIIIKNFPFLDSKQLLIAPPDYLKKLAKEKAPAKEYRQLELGYPELIPYLKKDEHIPVSDVLLKQIASKLTDWDDHGTPILLRGLRTLMHEERLLASQDAIAERLYSPFILAKLGIMDMGDGQPPWIPDQDALDAVRDDMDIALSSDFRLMVHHFGLDIVNVFGREQMPRLGDDFDRIERRLMAIFGINPSLLSAGNATQPYASSALQAEFLNQILRTYQQYLKTHYRERAMVVAEAQGHYDYEKKGQTKIPIYEQVAVYDDDGNKNYETRPKLKIPEMEMEVLDMRDEATERQFLQSLRAMGIPISNKTMMVGVHFDPDEEDARYNDELIKQTVAQQEAKMKTYNILRTKNYPIPPDLKMEVESALQQDASSPGQIPGGGGMAGQGGPGAGAGPGPSGGPGEAVVMPPPPPGLLGPTGVGQQVPGSQAMGGGAPPATPQGPMGPGGGSFAPPVSMERRPGMPRPGSVQKDSQSNGAEPTNPDDKVQQDEEEVPDKIIRELPKNNKKSGRNYSIIQEGIEPLTDEEETSESREAADADASGGGDGPVEGSNPPQDSTRDT